MQQELCKVLVLRGEEELGLGAKYKAVQLTVPAGCVVFPAGPAESHPVKELPALASDGWFELPLQQQICSLYNASGELELSVSAVAKSNDAVPCGISIHQNNLVRPGCTLSSTLGCPKMKHTARLLGRIS